MSEIFKEYAKLAVERGLIKEAKKEPEKPKSKYDSVDLEAVQMLYGIKVDDEEKSVLERAHPDPVIMAPSYDRANGLVENLLERHDIMTQIALKPTDGKLTHKRYVKASQELVNELLKSAFVLDGKGEEDLMKLADSCADKLVKEAWVTGLLRVLPKIWTVVKWVGTAIAVSKVVENHVNMSQGLINDIDHALKEISEIKHGSSFDNLVNELKHLRGLAEEAKTYRQGLSDILNEAKLGPTKDSAELSTGKFDHELLEFFEFYLEECKRARELVNKGIVDAERIAEEEKESFEGILGSLKKIYRMFEPDEYGDVPNALERFTDRTGLEGSLDQEIKSVEYSIQIIKQLAEKNRDIADVLNGSKSLEEVKEKEPEETEKLTEELIS